MVNVMIQPLLKTSVGISVLLILSACASQESTEKVAGETRKCRPNETLTCDEFSGEAYNCTCERGDNLRDMVDAYDLPDY